MPKVLFVDEVLAGFLGEMALVGRLVGDAEVFLIPEVELGILLLAIVVGAFFKLEVGDF